MFRKRGKAEGAGSVLRGMPFFDGFDDAELDRVAALADDVEADAGAILTEQGKPGQECFIIRGGTANVYVGGEHINTLGPGTVVGEMALISNRPRSATVVAETPMQLLSLDTADFRTLLEELPKAGRAVMALLEERLRQANLNS
jgi:CRP/FNR family transcriptional regulator, cyclic AMP receptor protein